MALNMRTWNVSEPQSPEIIIRVSGVQIPPPLPSIPKNSTACGRVRGSARPIQVLLVLQRGSGASRRRCRLVFAATSPVAPDLIENEHRHGPGEVKCAQEEQQKCQQTSGRKLVVDDTTDPEADPLKNHRRDDIDYNERR